MKITRLLTAVLVSLLVTTLPGIATALDDGIYIGASLGQASFEDKSIDDIDLSDDADAYKLFIGGRWGILGVEGAWVDFGKANSDSSGKSSELEVSGWSGFGMISLPIGPVDLFAKLGAILWDSDSVVGSNRFSDDGTDVAWGLGGAIRFGSISLRAEYEEFDVDAVDDLNMYSLGLAWTF